MCTAEPAPEFDGNLPPQHPTNRAAAMARNVSWNEDEGCYCGEAGTMEFDRLGQSFAHSLA